MVESKFLTFYRFNQKGQAAIEYILLLIITISMILLAIANLFKPMQSFMKDYMGTYVACLLASGELPAIRTENSLKDVNPKCNFSMPKGTATFNNNGSGSGSGSGNGSDSNGSNGKDGSGSDSANKSSKSGVGDGSGSDGSGNGNSSGRGSYAGSRSRNSGFGKSTFSRGSDRGGGAEDESIGSGGKRYVNNLDRNKDDRFFRNQQQRRGYNGRNGRGIALSGLTEEEQKKIERKIQSEPRVLSKNNEEFSVPAKKTLLKPPPIKEKKTFEEKEEGFSLGNLLKYILIAIVILLILILGGGQAFEMSKTMD